MVTWEEEVLPSKQDAWMSGTAKRATRDSYVNTDNDSVIVLAGADTPEKFLSTQYDIIWIWEARELSKDSVQVLTSRNRNGVIPFQQMVFDTNPAGRNHHLNKRFPAGYRTLPADHPARRIRPFEDDHQQVRLLSRHVDNPGFFDAYGQPLPRWGPYGRKLDRLVGARRRNLRDGDWASEEGMVLEGWDESIHLIDPQLVPEIQWTFASFDKGTRQPGCLGVWGVDADGVMYELAEVYRVGMGIDWWADVVVELDNEFHFRSAVSDHHPEWIEKFNDKLSEKGRPRLFQNANKDREVGIQVLQDAITTRGGPPMLYFVRGNLRYGRCPIRDQEEMPACTVEEIPDIVWAKTDDGKPKKEELDPACADFDHGFDQTRYAAMFRWRKDLTPKKDVPSYPEGTLGHLFGHDEILGPKNRLILPDDGPGIRSGGRWL